MEVDLTKPLNPCVYLMSHVPRVEYEGLHIIYFHCGQYDHLQEYCSQIIQTTNAEK